MIGRLPAVSVALGGEKGPRPLGLDLGLLVPAGGGKGGRTEAHLQGQSVFGDAATVGGTAR